MNAKLTTTQLADRIGVPRKWVSNAAYNNKLGMSYRPDSQVGQTNVCMQMHGLTWDDVHVRPYRPLNTSRASSGYKQGEECAVAAGEG
ncbi:hypothetical protein Defa_19880 [Desulfovibrio sp. TH_2024_36128]|uniref:Uncharacterized protein n=1 Tax=Desulfovibrio falkowii TaxID=3136602 RepID=A0ABQ0EA49_9BACT